MLMLFFGVTLSVAIQQLNAPGKSFKDIDNISDEEIRTGRGLLLIKRLWPWYKLNGKGDKPHKRTVINEDVVLPAISNSNQEFERLSVRIERDIAFFEEIIDTKRAVDEQVRERQMQHLKNLKKLYALMEKREKSCEEYYSEYENLRLKYIKSYKSRDG
ncbi:MAG TPA: hypothetical protein GXX26_01120 [Clostridiaceae bacterium]|nr:hypothetical protein [Clostridiaceae bacterium]